MKYITMKYVTTLLIATLFAAASAEANPIKVFILAGQSNMEGQGSVDHDYNGGKGNLVWSMANSKSAEKMKKLKNEKAAMWVYENECNLSSARSGSESVLKRIFCGIEGLERN